VLKDPQTDFTFTSKDNDPVNLSKTLNFSKEKDCVMNFNEYEIRLLHHNVQSLNNKLLDIAVMLILVEITAHQDCASL
jgi:hypothetical protein